MEHWLTILTQTRTLDTWNTMAYLDYGLGARSRVDRDHYWRKCL